MEDVDITYKDTMWKNTKKYDNKVSCFFARTNCFQTTVIIFPIFTAQKMFELIITECETMH